MLQFNKWGTKKEKMNQLPETTIDIPMPFVKEPKKSIDLSDISNDDLIAELKKRLL
jgi:hypothetical protein